MLLVQAFSLNSTANICRFFDICKYLYKFFPSFLQINFYVFVFQKVANIERKKKILAFTQITIYRNAFNRLLGCLRFCMDVCAFVGVVRFK